MFGWGKREKAKAQASSTSGEPDRYQERPLLRILENYVLDCIGELSSADQQNMASVVPSVFGGGTDWKKTLRGTLGLEDSMDEVIRQNWHQNQHAVATRELFGNASEEPASVSYAKQFVDDNFARLLE